MVLRAGPCRASSVRVLLAAASAPDGPVPVSAPIGCTLAGSTRTWSSSAGARLRLVALGVAGRQEPLVAPVELDLAPSRRRRAPGRARRCSSMRDPDAAAGEHELRHAARGLDVDQPGDEPGRRGGRQHVRVARGRRSRGGSCRSPSVGRGRLRRSGAPCRRRRTSLLGPSTTGLTASGRADLRDARQRLAVDLVGVQAAQLLGEAVAHLAAGQRDQPVRLPGLAQRADLARPGAPARPARRGAPGAPTPRPGTGRRGDRFTLTPQPLGQPARHQVGRRRDRLARDHRAR